MSNILKVGDVVRLDPEAYGTEASMAYGNMMVISIVNEDYVRVSTGAELSGFGIRDVSFHTTDLLIISRYKRDVKNK